ncbi:MULTISPECIES: hypothetical protein [unclassified Flavobacterium]|uniref:hypothetical protein n=1 Tax=unclassified Flavobacterium TaxID=196869 RepID=UPI0025BC013F|nr:MULTISPECIES: hypothetical protein [unclassified Flavobacterium]
MDKVSNILNNIKDRLSNPLIFSFLLSWLIFNWEITVALVWYDKSQINAEGCKSIFEFIQYKLDNRCGSFFFPFIIAIIYTLGFPYLKYGIMILNKKALNWGKRNEIKYIKEATSEKINTLKLNLNASQIEISKLNDLFNNINNNKFLNGFWKLTYVINGNASEKDIYISDGEYYEIENERRKKKFDIVQFYYNPFSNKILFMKKPIEATDARSDSFDKRYLVNILSVADNNNNKLLEGNEGDNISVSYKKLE